MLDLVGDGRADILVSEEDAFVWYRSRGHAGLRDAARATRPADEERGPARRVRRPTCQAILLADMTGDGLSDIVRVRNREVSYWPNLGYGRFGARVAMDDAPALDRPGPLRRAATCGSPTSPAPARPTCCTSARTAVTRT